jgi:hypothetical protein
MKTPSEQESLCDAKANMRRVQQSRVDAKTELGRSDVHNIIPVSAMTQMHERYEDAMRASKNRQKH